MTTSRERYAAAEQQGRVGALRGYNRHNNPYHIARETGMHEAWLRGLNSASADGSTPPQANNQ